MAGTVARFAVSGVLVLVGILLATTRISEDLGQRQGLDEARQIARLTGVVLVQPLLDPALLSGDVGALEDLNDVVRQSVLAGSLVRVKLWTTDGRIVYSDEGRLIGDTYPFAEDRREAIETGTVVAEISDLSAPENRFERSGGELVEVYVPLMGSDGQPVLYEAYFRLDGVRESGRRTWLAFAPVTVGSLLLLQLVQIPLAWSLARRVRSDAVQREQMLQRSLETSQMERRRIAADLHDGVVQDLTGVSYSLTAAAGAVDEADGVVARSADQIRGSIRQLRSLLVDIYPPDLATEGLGGALEDLLARHRAGGLTADLRLDSDLALTPGQAWLLYRVAQEALRNVAEHARATTVTVEVTRAEEGIRLRIDDDGAGFDLDAPQGGEDHFGLRILRDAAAESGGRLVLRSGVGEGTELDFWVPTP